MLYHVFKILVRISLSAYFKKINVIGKERLEEKGVVYVSNHPGAMMDPILIATQPMRSFHFIAGAEWFGKGLKRWLFSEQFNMIPVYRPWLAKDSDKKSNEDMFRACYEHLANGAGIMIFPEASSETVPWIRKLKTGAARIKIGGDEYLKGQGEVKIIPIGVNYINPHRFQTTATLVIGEPIDFTDLMESSMDHVDLSNRMTDQIKEAMQACVLHIESEDHYPVVKNAIKLMEEPVKAMQQHSASEAEASFRAKKEIVAAVEHFLALQDDNINRLTADLESYVERYESFGFRRFNPYEVRSLQVLGMLVKMTFLLPFFLVGITLNIIPFAISILFFRSLILKKVKEEREDVGFNPAFAGSLAYAVGVGVYLFWYAGLSIAGANMFSAWVAIPVILLAGYFTGRICLIYIRWVKKLRDLLVWYTLPKATRSDLVSLRSSLIQQLDVLKQRFVNQRQ